MCPLIWVRAEGGIEARALLTLVRAIVKTASAHFPQLRGNLDDLAAEVLFRYWRSRGILPGSTQELGRTVARVSDLARSVVNNALQKRKLATSPNSTLDLTPAPPIVTHDVVIDRCVWWAKLVRAAGIDAETGRLLRSRFLAGATTNELLALSLRSEHPATSGAVVTKRLRRATNKVGRLLKVDHHWLEEFHDWTRIRSTPVPDDMLDLGEDL